MPQSVARGSSNGPTVLTSRIFAPEPSAASFRLRALANAFSRGGDAVRVLTSRPPADYAHDDDGLDAAVVVRRARVLRDAEGYVRGYIQYMSFDIPLAFRMLFSRKPRLVITEPPPTTGAVVRVVCALRRVPYVYYAADVWADAVGAVDTPGLVARVVRWLELFALNGASQILSVSDGVTARLRELGISEGVHTIGNGVDLSSFQSAGEIRQLDGPYFLYAGTASEVHGAQIFLDAFKLLLEERPDVRLVYLGQGSDRPEIEAAAAQLRSGTVRFLPRAEPQVVAAWLRGAVASLASVRPGQGYDFAFPTKLYASAATGTPAVYAGPGPGIDFIRASLGGLAADYSVNAVAAAMRSALAAAERSDAPAERERLAEWARSEIGLEQVASRAVAAIGLSNSSVSSRRKGSAQ